MSLSLLPPIGPLAAELPAAELPAADLRAAELPRLGRQSRPGYLPVVHSGTPDRACAEATVLARAAAGDMAGDDAVGDLIEVLAAGDRVVTHVFECRQPGYLGWAWAVTVARASRARVVTVDEVTLLPGLASLLAPAWVPYSSRLRPDDLGPGDLLPTEADDARLVPGYADGFAEALPDDEADQLWPLQWELGLGRARVLSSIGLDDATDRWQDGRTGPDSDMARTAPLPCSSCGFLVRLAGRLGQAFGVCAHEQSPADGQVVALGYGCGAHSEVLGGLGYSTASLPFLDNLGYDEVDLPLEIVDTIHSEASVTVADTDTDNAGSSTLELRAAEAEAEVAAEAAAADLGHS